MVGDIAVVVGCLCLVVLVVWVVGSCCRLVHELYCSFQFSGLLGGMSPYRLGTWHVEQGCKGFFVKAWEGVVWGWEPSEWVILQYRFVGP